MSGTVATTAYFSVATNDISSYCTSITVDEPVEMQEDQTFGVTARKRAVGLKDWVIHFQLNNDFTNSLADDLLAAANGTAVAVEFRPASAAVGVNNPKRTGTGILSYTPLSDFTAGQLIRGSGTISCSNGIALIRAEA